MTVGSTSVEVVALRVCIFRSSSQTRDSFVERDSRKIDLLRFSSWPKPITLESKVGAQVKPAAEAPLQEARQSLTTGQRSEVLANKLAEDRRATDGLDRQLQSEVANSAHLLGQERQNGTATRQELTASTVQLRQALDEERVRSAALASGLAMAQGEIEMQAGQLRKVGDETAQLTASARIAALAQETAARQELTVSTAQHRQALDEERARSAALARELATAQREIETQAGQLRKADDEPTQQAEAAKGAQLLGQERQRTAALAEEAAAARVELTANAVQHRQALDEERARSAALASELATAQRAIETQVAQRRASDEIGHIKQAEAEKSAQSLEREQQRIAVLAQEAAAARQELTASTEQYRRVVDEERARRSALWSELATAQREIEVQAAQLRQASEETGQLKQATESATAELRRSLQQERDRTAATARDLESARRTVGARIMPEPAASNLSPRRLWRWRWPRWCRLRPSARHSGSDEVDRARQGTARSGRYRRCADRARARCRNGQRAGELHARRDI